MTAERVHYEGPVIRDDGREWFLRVACWRDHGQKMGSQQWVSPQFVPADADVRLPAAPFYAA